MLKKNKQNVKKKRVEKTIKYDIVNKKFLYYQISCDESEYMREYDNLARLLKNKIEENGTKQKFNNDCQKINNKKKVSCNDLTHSLLNTPLGCNSIYNILPLQRYQTTNRAIICFPIIRNV